VRSDAPTVEAYLDELPEDRREAISAVREVILANLPEGYEETMGWGMISYEVPLATHPDTYNGKPLVYAGLASQSRHMAVYLTNVYSEPALEARLRAGFEAAGMQPDMGKSCIRFRRLDQLPLEVIGEMVAATPVDDFIELYERTRGST
jgi:hypothetical protein